MISWDDIYRDLASCFPDVSVFVPSIGTALTAYVNRVISLLDNEKFQDSFLERTRAPIPRHIQVIVGESTKEDRSSFDKNGKWTLILPKIGATWYRQMSSSMGKDLDDLFITGGTKSASNGPGQASSGNILKPKTAGDWVDVAESADNGARVISLPDVSTLGKPESLFLGLLPYYIIVTNSGAHIHVESSHQPTLDLLHEYLSKNVRRNMNLTTQVCIP